MRRSSGKERWVYPFNWRKKRTLFLFLALINTVFVIGKISAFHSFLLFLEKERIESQRI